MWPDVRQAWAEKVNRRSGSVKPRIALVSAGFAVLVCSRCSGSRYPSAWHYGRFRRRALSREEPRPLEPQEDTIMTVIPADDPATRLFLRHALATLAYRAAKTVRGTPEAFGAYRSAPQS